MRNRHFNSLVFNLYCSHCETDSVIVQQRMINLPEVGKTLRINSYCEHCHANNSEFVPFHDKKNSVFKFSIKDKFDLNAKVIKSQTCTFRIPELGVELEPGPSSQAEIINVDGVLSNINLALEYEYGSNKLSNDIARIKQGKKKIELEEDRLSAFYYKKDDWQQIGEKLTPLGTGLPLIPHWRGGHQRFLTFVVQVWTKLYLGVEKHILQH